MSSLGVARELLASPRFAHALSLACIGTGFFADSLQRVIGWAGMLGVLATIVVLAVSSLIARRGEIGWQGVLPVSLIGFVGFAALSIFWSMYRWSTIGSVAYLVAFTVLGVYVALTRDTIQIVRSFGDVLRFVLGLSIVIEVISGVLIDSPIRFLGVEGNLAKLGPIQGVMGSRNQLGLVAVIAVITFAIEHLTRSVERLTSISSLVLASICIVLSRSPVIAGVVAAVLVAAFALYLVRRVKPEQTALWQWSTLASALVLGVVVWLLRSPIVDALSANSELTYRLALWHRLWNLVAFNPLEGWGWIGQWRPDIQPFTLFVAAGQREPVSAVNAYIDVWFQLGLAGIFIFMVLVGLAFVRSWLLAGTRRSIVFTWPALILVALIVSALAESSILVEYGWLTFVVCCVKAARELSWRRAFTAAPTVELPGA